MFICPHCNGFLRNNDVMNGLCPLCKKLFDRILEPVPNVDRKTDDLIHRFNRPRLLDKTIQELQGAAAAIIYDGKIDDCEIELLRKWMLENREFITEWPLNELNQIVSAILIDGVITQEERHELLSFLNNFAAGPEKPAIIEGIFDKGMVITFPDNIFMFTGKLCYGSRKKAEMAVIEHGGKLAPSDTVTETVNYLVVGDIGSPDYKFSRFGRKIEKAVLIRKGGAKTPGIVKEKDFMTALINI